MSQMKCRFFLRSVSTIICRYVNFETECLFKVTHNSQIYAGFFNSQMGKKVIFVRKYQKYRANNLLRLKLDLKR